MSDEAPPQEKSAATPERYVFSGYAIGAAAHCHKMGNENLKSPIQVPALGASVLPSIGGLSESKVTNFAFEVSYPSRRNLVSVHRIHSKVEGATRGTEYKTAIEAEIESITFIDKFHIDFARLHMVSTREGLRGEPIVTTDNRIVGIHLGGAEVIVELDNTLLTLFATKKQIEKRLERYPGKKPDTPDDPYHFNLVKKIEVIKRDQEKNRIDQIAENALTWDGFGTIFFGEVIVKNDDRQVTLVRLEMGSDTGGSGTVGDGHSNGSAGSNLVP